jgi:hypothetical protein
MTSIPKDERPSCTGADGFPSSLAASADQYRLIERRIWQVLLAGDAGLCTTVVAKPEADAIGCSGSRPLASKRREQHAGKVDRAPPSACDVPLPPRSDHSRQEFLNRPGAKRRLDGRAGDGPSQPWIARGNSHVCRSVCRCPASSKAAGAVRGYFCLFQALHDTTLDSAFAWL